MCFIQLFKAHDSFSSSFLDVRKDPKHLFRKKSKMGDQTNPLLTFRTRKVNKRIGLLRPKASFCNIFARTPHLTIFGATNMHIWHIWPYLACFAPQIWSLKRSCKMQFRRIGFRSIGTSSQKLQPDLIFGRFPHCNYNVKLESGGPKQFSLVWNFTLIVTYELNGSVRASSVKRSMMSLFSFCQQLSRNSISDLHVGSNFT